MVLVGGRILNTMSFVNELELPAEPPKKKLKTSDLPLSSATRSAIEGLAHTFKKKGGYDTLRKQVWEKFEASVSCLLGEGGFEHSLMRNSYA